MVFWCLNVGNVGRVFFIFFVRFQGVQPLLYGVMNNPSQPEKEKKKMVSPSTKPNKSAKKGKQSKVTLDSLQKKNPVMVTGEILTKCLAHLIANAGQSFTSYELAPIIGLTGLNDSKKVRDSFRAIGLKKDNLPINRGVVECPVNDNFAVCSGKVGARASYRVEKLG